MTNNSRGNARSNHESAFLLYSLVHPNYKTVSGILQSREFSADVYVTAEKVWNIHMTNDLQPPLEKYSRGTNGCLIAKYLIIPNDLSILRVVTLHDHRSQRVTDCPIPFLCSDIFFYVLRNDDLTVLTSSGLPLMFSGVHRVSLINKKINIQDRRFF
jgi:hypothetical protein